MLHVEHIGNPERDGIALSPHTWPRVHSQLLGLPGITLEELAPCLFWLRYNYPQRRKWIWRRMSHKCKASALPEIMSVVTGEGKQRTQRKRQTSHEGWGEWQAPRSQPATNKNHRPGKKPTLK